MTDTCLVSCILGQNFASVYKAPQKEAYFFTNNPALRGEIENKGWQYVFLDLPLSVDAAVSSLQAKYVKFLQFLRRPDCPPPLKSCSRIIYLDHKVELKSRHIAKLLAAEQRLVLVRKHQHGHSNIWGEVSASLLQERYTRFIDKIMEYVLAKIKQNNVYKTTTVVPWTSLILYRPQDQQVQKFTDEVYRDLLEIGTSECQIVWAMVAQKYPELIQYLDAAEIVTNENWWTKFKAFIRFWTPYGVLCKLDKF
ncbi:hypothetical protein NO1_0534 [Candidatus Termititenax aidoneus]|uniref:Uncharacterized protein n=1 Tax=Termititenax aidoneus TaxID=2218524 RepID=A0A388TA18_TERA1|nr:hypothetical protein NO1_0534 [Candidatus Termititenax aidoneus]